MVTATLPAGGRDLDEVTLRRAQRGDPAALRTLVERHHRAVWALAVRMLAGSPLGHRAEDVVQETFVRVHRALPGFDPAGPARLSTWILTIASRLVLNELRTAPRARASLPIDHAVELAGGDDPARLAEARQRAAVVAREVAALPDAARAVVVLREYHDLDYEEIARVLDVEIGTVKSRLSRARAQLRQRLRAAGAGGSDDA
jgi:RNA polymerase sigma-70 factor, ECF subfamily